MTMDPNKNNEFREKLRKSYNDKFKMLVGNFPKTLVDKVLPRFSVSKERFIYNEQILKYLFPLPNNVYNCTVFKVTSKKYDKKSMEDSRKRGGGKFGAGVDRDHDSTSCVYSYIYTDDNDEFKYFCYGPTFRSQDGEYRGRFLPFAQLEKIEKKFEKQLEQIEELIVEKMRNRELEFHADFCFSRNYPNDIRKFQDKIDNMRLVIRMFSLCWFCDFHRIYMKVAENHINPAYQYIMFDKNDIPVYNTIAKMTPNIDSVVDVIIQSFVMNFSQIVSNSPNYSQPVYTGQKVMPMTLREAMNIGDVSFPSWRELHITMECANLLANLISPCFPVVNNWFYIQNANAGVFDNEPQFERYADSKLATEIGEHLKDADRMTYLSYKSSDDFRRKRVEIKNNNKNKNKNNNKNNKKGGFESPDIGDYGGIIAESITKDKKMHENFKLEEYSRKINGAILYGESTIKLSDALLCMHVEQVGRTLRDIPAVIISRMDIVPSGYVDIFTRMETFCRHIFDAIYSFYCMNVKLLMMHSDAHLNNLTIFKQINYFDNNQKLFEELKNNRIVYKVTNNEDDIILDNFAENEGSQTESTYYMFEQRGITTMIIDFSRGILADQKRLIRDFGNIFAEQYMKKQNIRILKTIEHYFPSFFSKYRDKLTILVQSKFPLIFKAMSVLDSYTVASGLVNMFAAEKELKANPLMLKFSSKMKSLTEGLIVGNLEKIVNDEIKSTKDFKWPNLIVLNEMFDDFVIDDSQLKYKNPVYVAPDNITITDLFTNDRPVEYSFDTYDNYPPLMKFDIEEEVGTEVFGQPKPWIEKTRKDIRDAADARDHAVEISLEYKKEAYNPGELDIMSIPMGEQNEL